MSSFFSNRAGSKLDPGAFTRAIEEIDRVLRLPAGDPELLRMFLGVRNPVPFAVANDIALPAHPEGCQCEPCKRRRGEVR